MAVAKAKEELAANSPLSSSFADPPVRKVQKVEPPPPEELVTAAEGYQLELSSNTGNGNKSNSGYVGVSFQQDSGKFIAFIKNKKGKKVQLALFDTAVEAAVAIAKEKARIAAGEDEAAIAKALQEEDMPQPAEEETTAGASAQAEAPQPEQAAEAAL